MQWAERNSNFALGILLAALGIAVLAGGYASDLREFASAEFFPALIAACMCGFGVWLLAASWITRDLPPFRWKWWELLLAAAIALVLNVCLAMYFAQYFLIIGPPEYATTIVLLFAMAASFARRSHLRALGMVLIGLFLSTVGIDIITGRMRFTFGVEALFEGFDILILAPGMIVISEAMLCLYSPQLWFATFTRWLVPSLAIGPRWPVLLRMLCAIAITASLWLAWEVNHRVWDIAFSLLFGLFGVACLLFGWNRIILCIAFFYGRQLEESTRQSLVLARDNLSIFVERPFSRLHLWIAAAVLAVAFALWLWRVVKLCRATPTPPAGAGSPWRP